MFRHLGKVVPRLPFLCHSYSKAALLAKNSTDFLEKARNIAIIAHVDHGKTTLVDSLLRNRGVTVKEECAMDSNQLEREKGITILSKCTSVIYKDHTINIVDTPGHHDFGGEVERIMGIVDGVCLIICATEGPMTQSKFVLKKALQHKLKPIVIINKIDRPTARVQQVATEIFELFCELDCPDEFMQYPVYYASGKHGWAVKSVDDPRESIESILQGIVHYIPAPKVAPNKEFSMLVTQTHPNQFFGKMVLGRINSGEIELGKELKSYSQQGKLIETGKVTKMAKMIGLEHIELEKAFAGDIISIAGFSKSRVTNTIIEEGYPTKSIPCILIDEPLMGISVNVNNSPLAGQDGKKMALNDLKNRIKEEMENDVALHANFGTKTSTSISVKGRGDLHLGILLQKLRREGFEFAVTPPEIVFKIDPVTQKKTEPVEKVTFDVEQRFEGLIMEKMNHRQGVYISTDHGIQGRIEMQFICTTRSLIGIRSELLNETQGTSLVKTDFHEYREYSGPLHRNSKGALISMTDGVASSYTLKELEKFGPLFIKHGTKVYNGMVIGENSKQEDMEVNPTKLKQVTNIRTHGHDEKIVLMPPKTMSIEEAICYIREDELLEVTPNDVRIRKKELDKKGRETARRERKNQMKNMRRM